MTNKQIILPIEDRCAEFYDDGEFRRFYWPTDTITPCEGVIFAMVRTYIIGPDGLTDPERRVKELEERLTTRQKNKGTTDEREEKCPH